MATAKKTIKTPQAPAEPERLPFSRLKYNVDKKRALIKEHQAELIDIERELQLRCPHYDLERSTESTVSDDFYRKEVVITVLRCKECGLTRPAAM